MGITDMLCRPYSGPRDPMHPYIRHPALLIWGRGSRVALRVSGWIAQRTVELPERAPFRTASAALLHVVQQSQTGRAAVLLSA